MGMVKLIHGDCLEKMKDIPDKSVDMCLTDPPYGTTACKWDSVIPFEPMWEQLKRIVKDNGAICLFGSEPFSSALRMSNLKNYKYDWIWEKDRPSNINCANYQPMKYHELILVFNVHHIKYYPQKVERSEAGKSRISQAKKTGKLGHAFFGDLNSITQSKDIDPNKYTTNLINPKSILKFNRQQHQIHPTQKPVPLLEYLIKTYTIENETVLDFTMGSGSTGVACLNLNRNFIGIEKDDTYFEIAKKRIEK